MKKLLTPLVLSALFLLRPFSIETPAAQLVINGQTALNTFSGTGTGSTTLSYFIASGQYGQARLQYINATSDLSSSVIKFYTLSSPEVINIATNATQVTIYCANPGITNNNVCVLRNVAMDTYQRLVVSSATATSITFTANITYASSVGDVVYLATANGTIPVGAATKELNAASGAIYNGQNYLPLLFEVNGTSACSINCCSGYFDR